MGETTGGRWEAMATYRNFTKISVYGISTNIYAPFHLEGAVKDMNGKELPFTKFR